MTLRVSEVQDRHQWDREMSAHSAHPLQTALWGSARMLVDDSPDRLLVVSAGDNRMLWARVETRKAGLAGLEFARVAWIPRGPVLSVNPDQAQNCFNALEQYLGEQGYSLLAASGEYRQEPGRHQPVTSVIDLSQDLETLSARLHKEWRYGISRSERDGVIVSEDTSALPAFFVLCDRIAGVKSFELSVTEAMMSNLLSGQENGEARAWLFIANCSGEVGAGALVIGVGNALHYMWGGTDRDFSRQRPGEALHWHVIKWAKAHGFSTYDLEGIDLEGNPGTSRFKVRMGGDNVQLPGTSLVPLNLRGKLIKSVMKLRGRL